MLRAGPVFFNGGQRRIGINMASTGAILQLAYRIFGTVLHFLVWAGVISVGVTARTIWLIRGKLPCHHLRVIAVTLSASQVLLMIARIIQCGMREYVGIPLYCRVAVITLLNADKMPGILTRSNGSVVTG